jgi:predicted dehydrogenase/nucleoside-diphosphate-sugar epimerase
LSGTLKTAIVGCGRISDIHFDTLRRLDGSEVVALCDLDAERARAQADKFGVAGVFTDIEEMLDSARPDVVHLLTPPATHLPLVRAAAARGIHVYVEKPFATGEAEAREMAELARAAGVQLCPGHNRLYDPIFLEAERRVARGDIGRVVSVRCEQGFSYESAARAAAIPWAYGYEWGIYENLMPHPLYLVSRFLEQPGEPEVVAFDLGKVREAAVDELRVLIPSKSACAEVSLSLTTAPERNRIEIVGTRGRIWADYASLTVLVERVNFLPGIVRRLLGNLGVSWQLTRRTIGNVLSILLGRMKRYPGMRTLVEEFHRSIREGAPSPVSAEDGVTNSRQLEAIRRAAAPVAKRRPAAEPSPVSPPPKVLVTGATGMVGRRLVERLIEEGRTVRATVRVASRARPIGGVEWVPCRMEREDELRAALEGIETVFHCAALVAGPGTLADFTRANVDGTLELSRLAHEAGVRNLVYLSSIGVYDGPSRRRRYLDESSAYERRPADRGFYTQTKLEADRRLLQAARNGGAPRMVVLRPGTIYGPESSLPIGRLKLPSPDGRPVVAGSGRVAMPLTYVDNVIDAMLAAESKDVPSGRVYNLIDEPELDQSGVAQLLREESEGRIRPLFLPYPAAWSLMLALDVLSLVRGRGMGTARYRLKRTVADMRYPSRAAREELGWKPRVGPREGLRRVIEQSREPSYPH